MIINETVIELTTGFDTSVSVSLVRVMQVESVGSCVRADCNRLDSVNEQALIVWVSFRCQVLSVKIARNCRNC